MQIQPNRSLRLAAVLAACLAPLATLPAVRADEPATQPMKHQHSEAGETFENSMDDAGGVYKSLKKSDFTAESRAADLKHVGALQVALLTAKSVSDEMPEYGPAEKKYGDDVAAYRRDLRAGLVEAIAATLKLETAINAGDAKAAKAAFEEVSKAQYEGHKSFRPGRDNIGKPGEK